MDDSIENKNLNAKLELGALPARKMQCNRHGLVTWRGDIVCGACGRIYQTQAARKPRFVSPHCECGAQLLPPAGAQVPTEAPKWTARACCFHCARQAIKRNNGIAILPKSTASTAAGLP